MADGSQRKILLVDDEKELTGSLKNFLEPRGFTVFSAEDGRKGLEIVQAEMPDLIILDITMPRFDGRDMLARLKDDDKMKNIPVIILSARGDEYSQECVLEYGALKFISKPFRITEVMASIKEVLN